MSGRRIRLAATLAVCVLAWQGARAQTRPVLQVRSAFALERPLREIAAAYQRKTGVAVSLSFAGSSSIAQEIEQGGRPNIVVCARRWLDGLAQAGRLATNTETDLASTRLVLIAPVAATVPLRIREGFSLSAVVGEGHFAIGDPRSVPSGYYGKIAVSKLGGWLQVGPRIARADVVRAVIDMVANGKAILGLVYDTDVKDDPRVKIIGYFPETQYPQISYSAALVGGAQPSEAGDFLRFLKAPEAASTFKRFGFIPVSGAGSPALAK
jgi:molybdate transport system substrate-binding protein